VHHGYGTADDLLPARRHNWRRQLSDAEVVTLCVAQVMMGISSANQSAAGTSGERGWRSRSTG
jgi:hypothetical protein